jgi:DNA-binding CsgD family transcriptional regulator
MAWLDEADVHATERLRFALDDAQMPIDLRRSALEELVRLVPSDLWSWHLIALAGGGAPEARSREPSEAYGELLHPSRSAYDISIAVQPGPGEAVVFALARQERRFSERDRDVLDLAQPAIERALQAAEARQRLLLALTAHPPPGAAVVLLDAHGEIETSSPDAARWLAEHFGAAQHPGWLPDAVAAWLALPPRPPLQSTREGRRLTVRLLPGEPHALLLEEEIECFRVGALQALGLTGREREVLDAARSLGAEADVAGELFLSLHAVRERLERLEAKLGVSTLPDAIAAARRASL